MKKSEWKNGLRICSQHSTESVIKTKDIMRNKRRQKLTFKFDVPDGSGVQTFQNGTRTTTAKERKVLKDWTNHENDLATRHGKAAAKEIVKLKKTLKHVVEKSASTQFISPSQETYLTENFNVSIKTVDSSSCKSNQSRYYKRKCVHKKVKIEPTEPVVKPGFMSPKEIKRRTGFDDEKVLLSYIAIICNGDADTMFASRSQLTWFEEWLLYFEILWGRTWTRWEDLCSMYKISRKQDFYSIFDEKCSIALRARSSWPRYASFEEDEMLRKEKWNAKYEGKRVVMWDDTNIPFSFKPGTALNQRTTYSSYYGMNCAKGGVSLQLCGWIGVEELWCGATSDSHYQENTSILSQQEIFAKNDKVGNDSIYIPFTIILDKGYRIIRAAWRAGKQICCQPIFASSDRLFRSDEVLISASVAADRSGNERAVNLTKMSGLLKRGLRPNACPIRLNNVWLAWSFQINFMYASVL